MLKQVNSFFALLVLTTFSVSIAYSQSEKKFEIGAQFSTLGTQTHSVSGITIREDQKHVQGFGGRFGYNATEHIALEAEVNYFPRDRDLEGGRKFQGVFGVKVGQRFDKVGVFAKARPGFVRFERGDYFPVGGCIAVFPPPLACFQSRATTNFAFDVGGIVEVYPSKNTLIRFDVGDTLIRFDQRNVAATSDVFAVLVAFPAPAETKHNLQASVGFGFRF